MSDRRGQPAHLASPHAEITTHTHAVAVVIPTFNGSRTIDAALASVAAQSLAPDEVVVVDDGSTDDTVARVETWADRLPLVIIRNERNCGIAPTRSRGITAAHADLIALLDHDDVWLPDHLATVVPLAADGHTIVASRCLRWSPGSAVAPDRTDFPPPERLTDDLLQRNYMVTGSVFPRAAFLALERPITSRTVDDWETWIRLVFEHGCRIAVSPSPTILYRASASQASAGGDGCLPDEIELLERLRAEAAYGRHRDALDAALRRRRLRAELVDAMALAAAGRHAEARRRFVSVAVRDRSIRGWTRPGGSLAVRAALGAVSPQRFLDRRSSHLRTNGVAAPTNVHPAPAPTTPTPDPSEAPCTSSATTTT